MTSKSDLPTSSPELSTAKDSQAPEVSELDPQQKKVQEESKQDPLQFQKPNDKQLIDTSEWTPYTDLILQAVDKNYPKQIALQTAGLVFIIITAVMFIMNIKEQAGLTVSLKVISVIGLFGFIAVYLQYKAAKNLCYGVLEHELVVRKGLWWISTTTLPFTRLQHVSLSQNPLQRRFSLATLKCFSAGSGAAEIYLPGLLFNTAEHLRQHLLNKATIHQSASDQSGSHQSASGNSSQAEQDTDIQTKTVNTNSNKTSVPSELTESDPKDD
ncbi:PH domain-containing protein [Shewanella olleyana]|uniref:PH domain-containing protein n=1 Tax=Shewanella olleyana TaxID=135626 RepID=UPI00200CF55A|nr:PH domain-containing protein [Shewanella olleyana]MCL1066658.1 PH domain-containing protein [Shewanella olleyana]